MFRFPLQVSKMAAHNMHGRISAVIADARGVPLLTLAASHNPDDDNKRAEFVRDSLNNPMHAALRHCQVQQAIAGAQGDARGVEFWQRLAGSCRKACEF